MRRHKLLMLALGGALALAPLPGPAVAASIASGSARPCAAPRIAWERTAARGRGRSTSARPTRGRALIERRARGPGRPQLRCARRRIAGTGRPTGSRGSPAPLLVSDVSRLSADERLLFAALQGIAHRRRPRVYLTGVDDTAAQWPPLAVPLPTATPAPY